MLIESYRPDQIIRDPACTNWEHDWIVVRRLHSRWSLADQYPEHRDIIVSAPSPGTTMSTLSTIGSYSSTQLVGVFEDQIEALEFWHRPTASLPEGRATIVVNGVAIEIGRASCRERV